jgi:hypothetical protein
MGSTSVVVRLSFPRIIDVAGALETSGRAGALDVSGRAGGNATDLSSMNRYSCATELSRTVDAVGASLVEWTTTTVRRGRLGLLGSQPAAC